MPHHNYSPSIMLSLISDLAFTSFSILSMICSNLWWFLTHQAQWGIPNTLSSCLAWCYKRDLASLVPTIFLHSLLARSLFYKGEFLNLSSQKTCNITTMLSYTSQHCSCHLQRTGTQNVAPKAIWVQKEKLKVTKVKRDFFALLDQNLPFYFV